MRVTKQFFADGMLFDTFVDETEKGRLFREEFARVEIPVEAAQRIEALSKERFVLAIVEDWCGDCLAALPVIAKCCVLSSNLILRVFRRDDNEELMDAFAEDDKRRIPVIAVYDEKFDEVARMIERPASIEAKVADLSRRIVALPEGDAERERLKEEKKAKIKALRVSGETARAVAETFAAMVGA